MWRGGEGEERKFPSFLVFLQHPLPYPFPAVSLAPFLARSLTLVRGSRAFTYSELTVTGTQRPLDNLFGPLICFIVCHLVQPRPQGLLAFQYGGGRREGPGTQRTKTIADWCIRLRVHTCALIGLLLPKQRWLPFEG